MKSTIHTIALCLLLAAFASSASAQSVQGPPKKIDYQGKVLDSAGSPLALTGPANYLMVFRIYDAQSGGNLLWSEQQTVTVSNGLFSVRLGEGARYQSEPSPTLDTVFGGGDRFLGMTVATTVGDINVANYQEITPRLTFLSSPFSFVSAHAVTADSLNQGTGTTYISSANIAQGATIGGTAVINTATITTANITNLNLSGGITDASLSANVDLLNKQQAFTAFKSYGSGLGIASTNLLEFGYGVSGKEGSAGKIGYQAYSPGLDIVGAGTAGNNRLIKLWSEGGLYTTGPVYAGGDVSLPFGSHVYLGDSNHNLVYDGNVNGPVLSGFGGGALGSYSEHFAVQWDRAGNVYMPNGTVSVTGGSLGVGTTTPGTSLEVNGGIRARGGAPGANGVNNNGYAFSNGGDTDGGMFSTADGLLQFFTNSAERMRIDSNGLVGINGGSNSAARVYINGGGTNAYNDYNGIARFGSTGNGNAIYDNSGDGFVTCSLLASNNIAANRYYAFSDERIKNIRGVSDGNADLQTLMAVQITDYTYRDVIDKGAGPQKKVIAQQVEKVFPQAVDQHKDVIPDIYRKASISQGWVSLATDLKVGERVRLIGEKTEGVHEVLEVTADKFRTGFSGDAPNVFVFGREVKDFRTVDYEAISMLNVSATQQIKKEKDAEVKSLQEENATLRSHLAAQDKRLVELEEHDQNRDRKLAALEKLLEAASRETVRPAIFNPLAK